MFHFNSVKNRSKKFSFPKKYTIIPQLIWWKLKKLGSIKQNAFFFNFTQKSDLYEKPQNNIPFFFSSSKSISYKLMQCFVFRADEPNAAPRTIPRKFPDRINSSPPWMKINFYLHTLEEEGEEWKDLHLFVSMPSILLFYLVYIPNFCERGCSVIIECSVWKFLGIEFGNFWIMKIKERF